MIIGIDGPAGSGKTTVAKLLAKRLGIFYLDTGAMYRALTLKAIAERVELTDNENLGNLAETADLEIKEDRVYLSGEDVSSRIRSPLIDKSISLVVAQPRVRAAMVKLQRKIVNKGDFVVEGRDITTVVFPQAQYKFYLDASSLVRAQRRFKELKSKGIKVRFQELAEDLKKRDTADKTREVSPLKISEEAICLDTTNLTSSQTVEAIIQRMGLGK
ncbi:MAG: (d)CMP kinase [Candidatus Omnitrophota bacterium]